MWIKTKIKNLIYLIKTERKIPVPTQIDTTNLLKGKVALVAGGNGGIGRAIAASFIKNGAKVIITGTNEEKLKHCVDELNAEKDDDVASYYVLNVSEIEKIPEGIGKISDIYGQIDILVNSFGVISKNNFFGTTAEEYDQIMDINVRGVYFMCQAVAKYMIAKEIKGHILNVSSASALRPAWTPYQMSKWSIRGFTMGLADTLLPYGIIVNAIGPGPVATPMLGKSGIDDINNDVNPSGRFATPDEIANLATFMVSDMGNLIVGDTYYMTGGGGTISMHK